MKLNPFTTLFLAVFAFVPAAHAAVTVAFNAPFTGGMSSNLANTAGVVSNGMTWGILIDTTGNGILITYDFVTLTPGASYSLTSLGSATGDRLILAADLTSDSSQGGVLMEGDGTTFGGNGGVSGLSFALGSGVAAGNAFSLVWFDQATLKAGILGSSQFIVPADGQTVTYAQVFEGVDPLRPAIHPIFFPEPSSAMLGLLGAIGLLRRRRQ